MNYKDAASSSGAFVGAFANGQTYESPKVEPLDDWQVLTMLQSGCVGIGCPNAQPNKRGRTTNPPSRGRDSN